MKELVFILVTIILNLNVFGQIKERILYVDTLHFENNGNVDVNSEIDSLSISKSYHDYHPSYLNRSKNSNHDVFLKSFVDSIFFLSFVYDACCGEPDYLDSDKLKVLVHNQDSFYYIKQFDPYDRIIIEGLSKTIFPFEWAGKTLEYYSNGNVKEEVIYKGDSIFSEQIWTEDGEVIEDVYFYNKIDTCPNFVNSNDDYERNLTRYFQSNLIYSSIAKELGFSGTVYMSFIITKFGTIEQVRVFRGVHPIIDNHCVEIIKQQPVLSPGQFNGKPVNVLYSRNIKFFLD